MLLLNCAFSPRECGSTVCLLSHSAQRKHHLAGNKNMPLQDMMLCTVLNGSAALYSNASLVALPHSQPAAPIAQYGAASLRAMAWCPDAGSCHVRCCLCATYNCIPQPSVPPFAWTASSSDVASDNLHLSLCQLVLLCNLPVKCYCRDLSCQQASRTCMHGWSAFSSERAGALPCQTRAGW